MQYTGGTTGVEKGEILLNKNIIDNICIARIFGRRHLRRHRCSRLRARRPWRGPRLPNREGSGRWLGVRLQRPRRARAQGRSGHLARTRGRGRLSRRVRRVGRRDAAMPECSGMSLEDHPELRSFGRARHDVTIARCLIQPFGMQGRSTDSTSRTRSSAKALSTWCMHQAGSRISRQSGMCQTSPTFSASWRVRSD